MEKNLICIICPRGCAMTASMKDGTITVTGHSCPRGEQYAIQECTDPRRTVTSTIRLANREASVSVKTETPVPKARMMEVMARLRAAVVHAPVAIGDVLLEDVCGSRIVATKTVK